MTTFFTGCNHFGHENILDLANRPFGSLQEMEEVMTERWNQTVKDGDTVYQLGDFSFKAAKDPESYLERLNGNIIRLQGNHDPKNWGVDYLKICDNSLEPFRENGLQIVMMHYPIEEWDSWFDGSIHLHCHTHKPEFVSAKRRGNVGVDSTGFKPISLEEVVERLMPGTLA